MKMQHILYCILIAGFTLGIYRGQLALWKSGEPEPVEVFPLSADSLPEEDQKLLEEGIPIGDIRELTERLEDFLS